MATILEAVKWMREGKTVHREGSTYTYYAVPSDTAVILHERDGQVDTAVFLICDLTATDWQLVADPAPPAGGSE